MKVVIKGGTGFIGSNLADELVDKHNVVIDTLAQSMLQLFLASLIEF
jgi:nucleoside-diphosphate-sugar epimerase